MIRGRAIAFFVAVVSSLLLLGPSATAQSADQSNIYLDIYDTELQGRLELRVVDVNAELGLGLPNELEAAEAVIDSVVGDILAHAEPRFGLGTEGESWTIEFTDDHHLAQTDIGLVVVLPFSVAETFDAVPETVEVSYEIFVADNGDHRAFFHIGNYWEGGVFGNTSEAFPEFFDAADTRHTFELDDPDFWAALWGVMELGVDHIRLGTDHVLFIVALLLPSVLVFTREWEPAPSFSSSLWRILKVATSFAVANSITLSLTAYGVIELPSTPVDVVIAISIVVAALHALHPVLQHRGWMLAVVVGLVHGLGSAGLLTELGLDRTKREWSLVAFNVGVEISVIVIVLLVFPALFLLRRTRLYHAGFVRVGSVVVMALAGAWGMGRIFDTDLGVDELIDPLVEVPWAYLYVAVLTAFAAGWRYREMQRGKLLWLPDAEDLETDIGTDHRPRIRVG